MELKRLSSETDELFAAATELYESAFPPVERRDRGDHTAAMRRAEFNCDVIVDGGEFIGIAFFWDGDGIIYLEHLAIRADLRGKGYGKRALSLLKSIGKPVILEIEPPETSAVAAARRRFYESEGFVYNEIDHLQLHYRKGDADCMLRPMSFPAPLGARDYERFNSYLHSTVASYSK